MKIVVYTKRDYSEFTELILRDGLTKQQITNCVNQRFKEWYYWDIVK